MQLRIAVVEPGQALVVTSEGGAAPKEMGFDFTWAFVLTALGDGGTRLHVRERYRTKGERVRAETEVTSLVSAVMSWRMLRTIKELADGMDANGLAAAATS